VFLCFVISDFYDRHVFSAEDLAEFNMLVNGFFHNEKRHFQLNSDSSIPIYSPHIHIGRLFTAIFFFFFFFFFCVKITLNNFSHPVQIVSVNFCLDRYLINFSNESPSKRCVRKCASKKCRRMGSVTSG
jgi:hypothetical protein